MTTTLKQFQGSLVDPKDDAKVYQFLGGISGVVAGCVVTLYATNQLKISDGWGFACGRVFTIEEEIVVANTAAVKGRIIVNIDLENIAKPACLATQSAAVLPALVQEDINADGTSYQLALAQYDIVSNTITNLTDVRVMLYDVDSRINAKVDLGETSSTAYRGDRGKIAYDHSQATGNPHSTTKTNIGLGNVDNTSDANKPVSTATQTALNAKQDKITNTANRLFYGSGTSGTLSQLALPSVAGSVLQQDTSGAPYWGTSLLKTQSFIGITRTTGQSITATSTKLTFNSILTENDPLSILSLYSNGIRCASAGNVKIWGTVDITPSASNTSGGVGHIILYQNGSVVNYFTRTYISLNNQTTFSFDPIVMGVAANDYFNFYVYSPVAGTTGSGLTMRMYAEYIN